jgi:hypothetical protein
MSNGLTTDPGLSIPTGLSPSSGMTVGTGLSFQGFGGGGPVISNGILLENGTDFLMLENGTEYLLQE